jgi:DNA modification methylase
MRGKDGKVMKWTHVDRATQDFKIPDNVIRVTRQRGGIGKGIDHPAVFPVGLPEHMMLTYSAPRDICYEPFSGSGTSLIAAEKTGRALRAVELAPVYVDVALERFRRLYPSIPIILDGTGEAFSEVAARRAIAPATAQTPETVTA